MAVYFRFLTFSLYLSSLCLLVLWCLGVKTDRVSFSVTLPILEPNNPLAHSGTLN